MYQFKKIVVIVVLYYESFGSVSLFANFRGGLALVPAPAKVHKLSCVQLTEFAPQTTKSLDGCGQLKLLIVCGTILPRCWFDDRHRGQIRLLVPTAAEGKYRNYLSAGQWVPATEGLTADGFSLHVSLVASSVAGAMAEPSPFVSLWRCD